MEQVLFKISFPAEFHAANRRRSRHDVCTNKWSSMAGVQIDIAEVTIETQESGKRIIDKKGPLNNPADRDHCIQYMVAVPC